jgi:hypothetical protein
LIAAFSPLSITKGKALWTRSIATQLAGALPQCGKNPSEMSSIFGLSKPDNFDKDRFYLPWTFAKLLLNQCLTFA